MSRKRRKNSSGSRQFSDDNKASLSKWEDEEKSFNRRSKNNENLLMIEVENGNLEIVKFLLSKNANVNHLNAFGETASDVAWKNQHFGILIELLKNDAPYPKSFIEGQVELEPHSSQIKMLVEKRKGIHDVIKNNFLDELQVLTENDKLKFAYDKNNQCALTTAIKSKKFEAYSLLRSKGFADGIDFRLDFHLQNLDENDKLRLRETNLKYFDRNINQHVMDLVSKSRLAFGNDQNNFSKIQKWFEMLDGIPELCPILKIVSASDKTDIVFDFKSDSVKEMDPTGSEYVKGRTYAKSGNIFIGARRNDKEILGTLAHEMTHYALQLVYNNGCLPFNWDDGSRENDFEAIVESYNDDIHKIRNNVIKNALSYDFLADKMRELIVRVPHLLALHSNETETLASQRGQSFV